MVNVIHEGDGDRPAAPAVTAYQATAYAAAAAIPSGSRTSEQQQIVDSVEETVATIASADWTAKQQAAQATILEFTADLQSEMQRIIRQYAPKGQERAYSEMFSVVTKRLSSMYRDIVELQP